MGQRIVVIGAGIVGAAIAMRLAQAGHHVTILDAVGPAAGASGRSFGWINASFFADEAHFRLRTEGIAAWRRLNMAGLTWHGALWYEEDGEGFDRMEQTLQSMKYPVEVIGLEQFSEFEPHVSARPQRALRFTAEAAAETGQVTQTLLGRALEAGAILMGGTEVLGIETTQGAVTQVVTSAGVLPADQLVVAAGTRTPDLLSPLGIELPMLTRPGLLVTTRPLPPVLAHVLVAPGQELRQLPDGRLLAPTSPNHQADSADRLSESALTLADQTIGRVASMLGGQWIAMEQVSLAMRPVPRDGLPVVGAVGPDGLYVATMHSGVTLAAIIGELVAQELTNGGLADLLSPYRPQRFAGQNAIS